jgi:hypothetical protein
METRVLDHEKPQVDVSESEAISSAGPMGNHFTVDLRGVLSTNIDGKPPFRQFAWSGAALLHRDAVNVFMRDVARFMEVPGAADLQLA